MSSTINLGLERIRDLLARLPAYTRPTCHIAGTNGKGSVTALLSSVLKASSYRVGRFNSPHLVSVLDSITIDEVPVSQAKYTEIRQHVEEADRDHTAEASSFELLTATALMIFEDAKVDIAVVEVGMGGRLDATNIIPDECILVSALTAVDLDHQAFLGNTVEEIAAEKAAIARKGRPFVLGQQTHPEVKNVVHRTVSQIGGTVVESSMPWKREWDPSLDGGEPQTSTLTASGFIDHLQPVTINLLPFPSPINLLLPLKGDHQLGNLGTALTIVSALLQHQHQCKSLDLRQISPETVANGVRNARWAGRLSFHTISLPLLSSLSNRGTGPSSDPSSFLVLADGAHNRASSATLSAFITDLLSQRMKSSPTASCTITISYVLALSHSPPKAPQQTLVPLFSPIKTLLTSSSLPENMTIRVQVALLRFTPPEGMPWVRSELPAEIHDVVASLIPEADIWISPDETSNPLDDLEKALNWAAKGQQLVNSGTKEGLIVVAGSLYLVADFYRLLRTQKSIEL